MTPLMRQKGLSLYTMFSSEIILWHLSDLLLQTD